MYSSSDEFVNLEPLIGGATLEHPVLCASDHPPWTPYDGTQFIGSRCGGSNDVNSCISLTRIAIILGYYKEWIDSATKQDHIDVNSMYDFINTVFDSENGYSNHQLLNDYHHLIDDHSHQFEDIYNRIIKQCDDNIMTSYIIKRNYRTKTKFDKQQNNALYFISSIANKTDNDNDATKERCIQQILDTISSYYLYSFRFGYILNKTMKEHIKSKETDNDNDNDNDETKHNNTQQKPSRKGLVFKSYGRASLSKKPKYKKPKEVQEMLNMFTLIKSNRNKVEKTLPNDIYNTIYDTKNNRFMSITRFVKNRNRNTKHKHDEDEDEKDDKKTISTDEYKQDMNGFGYRYYYTQHCKKNNSADIYNIGYKYNDWYIAPHYKSLKDEVLSISDIYCIDIEQWNEISEKAAMYLNTDMCKKMKSEGSPKEFDVISGSLIEIHHLIALLLYTNVGYMEYALSATYRKLSITETDEALKKRHSYLGNLGRYLSESVQCFGKKPAFNKTFEYFHIINKSINMPSSILYNAPISLTTSKMVGINALYSYNDNTEGLILEIGARDTKQIDCKYFSERTNEYEIILFQCNNPITVQNVIDLDAGINYHIYLYAFRLINALLDGSDLNKKQRGVHFEMKDIKIITPIYKFLYHKFYGKQNEFVAESLPLYVEQILNSYFNKLTEIQISWNQMSTLKRKITGYNNRNTFNIRILSFIQPFICYYNIEWIKWHLMVNAFKNLKCITIHSIKLSKAIFEDILFHMESLALHNKYNLETIVLQSPVQYNLSCAVAREQFNQRFLKLNWQMLNPMHHELRILRKQPSLTPMYHE